MPGKNTEQWVHDDSRFIEASRVALVPGRLPAAYMQQTAPYVFALDQR